MHKIAVISSAFVLFACSSSSGGGGSSTTTELANPCATENATYEETFTEQAGGTCGPLSPQVINTSANGTITTSGPKISCSSSSETGCTVRDSACEWSQNGVNFSATIESTFSSDGSSATGLYEVTATGADSCSSTYTLTITRQ